MAVVERVRAETGLEAETMWTDDGFVVRFPETETPPDPGLMLPASEQLEDLVLRQLGGSALFAAKFREAAGRALLLPKRRPGGEPSGSSEARRGYAAERRDSARSDDARGVPGAPAGRFTSGAGRDAAADQSREIKTGRRFGPPPPFASACCSVRRQYITR